MSEQVSTKARSEGPPSTASRVRRSRRARAAVAAAAVLVVLLAGCGALLYAAFVRKPVNHPAAFLEKGRAPGTQAVVVNAGSSTTHATLSSDYVALLRERFGDTHDFVNAGVNGATSESLLGRLDEIIACRPDLITVLLGGNDVRDGITPDAFRANMDTILSRLRTETGARIAVLSLTPHGERLDSAANRAQAPYNAAIQELAAAHDVTYLPLRETMRAIIERRPGPHVSEPPALVGSLVRATVRRYAGRQSFDEIASANGLFLLSDHVHLSDRGAAVVADLITDWLTDDAPTDGVPQGSERP